MYILTVKGSFDAAHRLNGYTGDCKYIHGHTYKYEVSVSSEELDKLGIAIDFKVLKEDVNKFVEPLDHTLLLSEDEFNNGINIFGTPVIPFNPNPTAEVIARDLYLWMEDCNYNVVEVRIWETDNNCATFRK